MTFLLTLDKCVPVFKSVHSSLPDKNSLISVESKVNNFFFKSLKKKKTRTWTNGIYIAVFQTRNAQYRLGYVITQHNVMFALALSRKIPLNSICDTRSREDSALVSVHLENNLIDRRLIPPMTFSCLKNYYSVQLWPQHHV